jgi:NAD-dependent deacetylase
MMFLDAKPNKAHLKLAELEKAGKLKAIVTQNIDGLHQAAGSKVVYELHGSIHRNYCQRCMEFYDFYKEKMMFLDAKPNKAHLKLAELEKAGKLKAIVTQNIDGLHQLAGSETVYEIHGSVMRNYCKRCGEFYDVHYVKNADGVPKCSCGGTVKPDVVLYEEQLNTEILEESIDVISNADMLIVAGTSLAVYPAAGLIRYYQGNRLVLINRDPTPFDGNADLVFHETLGNIFSKL